MNRTCNGSCVCVWGIQKVYFFLFSQGLHFTVNLTPMIRLGRTLARPILRSPPRWNFQKRNFTLSPRALGAVKGWGTVANIAAGAYIGGLVVCFGSLYLMYLDADERQHIPFELSFKDQINAVKAVSKDDVLKSPRYAVKHYRRLLIDLAQQEDPHLEFEESLPGGQRNYAVPLLSADALVYRKSADFANFYIDISLRYAKSLLAKGKLEDSLRILKYIIDDDEIFYKLGDAERMSQCCRLLARVTPNANDKVAYLQRLIDMLGSTFLRVNIDSQYLLQDNSRVTDELLLSLDSLALSYAKQSKELKGRAKTSALSAALNIYLANLKCVTQIQETIESGELTQALFPLFNCSADNLDILVAETKSHISEVMWAKGYKKNAVAWGEEVVEQLYLDNGNNPRASPILISVLDNLVAMYAQLKDKKAVVRCEELRQNLRVFEGEPLLWYDSVVHRFTKIIYYKGPLGIIEKALKERFGRPEKVPDIEEYEDEDEET